MKDRMSPPIFTLGCPHLIDMYILTELLTIELPFLLISCRMLPPIFTIRCPTLVFVKLQIFDE